MKLILKKCKTNLVIVAALLVCSISAHAAPAIQSWQTKNGGKVLFIETHTLPIVDVELIFAAGSARDGKLLGVAKFSNALLDSGAGKWNADKIAEQLDNVGAQLNTQSARDMGMVTLRSLSEKSKLKSALAVLEAVVGDPQFNQSDIERDRQRMLSALQHKQQQPRSIASDAFMEMLYGSHPYGHPSEGTIETINLISRSDLLAFHKRYYVAHNAVLALVGDLTRHEAEVMAEQILGSLPEGEAAPALPEVKILQQAQQQRIAMPITQTHIIMGQPAMRKGDPDFFPLYVGNHVLGGSGFGSRLMAEIREQRGLAYDTHSYFAPMMMAGPFQAAVQTRNEQATEVQQLLQKIITQFIKEGPTAEELDKAIKNITGGFPLNIDSNSELIGYLGMIGFYDFPLDHLETFIERVRAVTAEQIRDAFQRRVQPEHFVTVIVGGSVEE